MIWCLIIIFYFALLLYNVMHMISLKEKNDERKSSTSITINVVSLVGSLFLGHGIMELLPKIVLGGQGFEAFASALMAIGLGKIFVYLVPCLYLILLVINIINAARKNAKDKNESDKTLTPKDIAKDILLPAIILLLIISMIYVALSYQSYIIETTRVEPKSYNKI